MKLAIAAILVASAAAFAPSASIVSRSSSLGYNVHIYNEDDGIDAILWVDEDTYILGE